MKIKFNLDDGLPLNKTLEIHGMIIVVRVVFLCKEQIVTSGFCRRMFA